MSHRASRVRLVSVSLVGLALSVLLSGGLAAQDKPRESRPRFALDARCQLGRAVKGAPGWFELTCYVKDKKGKLRKRAAYLRLTDETKLCVDLRVSVDKIKEGEQTLLFGRVVEREIPSRGGGGGRRDYQIQNCQVVIVGELDRHTVANRELKLEKLPDSKWSEGVVTKAGGGLEVRCDSQPARVTFAKNAPAFRRTILEREKLKGRPYLQVMAERTKARPETGKAKDDGRRCFEARTVIVLDRRYLKTVYPLLWNR